MNNIDRTMTIIDQYQASASRTHWCTRWGESSEEAQRSQNANAVLDSIPAALSIADLSTENFSTPPPWQPVDFLSLAAYSRAHRYVQHVLDEQPS